MARLSGKLTPKSLGWDRASLATDIGKIGDQDRIRLGRFAGIVSGLRTTVNDDTGEVQYGLRGQFRGVSAKLEQVPVLNKDGSPKKDNKGEPVLQDGGPITVTSGVCYLPGGMQDMIMGALAAAQEADAKATVQFALDLYGIRAANKAGYSFVAENLIEAEEADPLDMLLSLAGDAATKALPAPEGEGDDADQGGDGDDADQGGEDNADQGDDNGGGDGPTE
jgi:hypothetical protein